MQAQSVVVPRERGYRWRRSITCPVCPTLPYAPTMRHRSIAFAAIIALLVASCGDGAEVAAEGPGRLVLWNDDAISILADGEFSDVDVTGNVSQVTPAPDGTLIWTRIERTPPSVDAVIDGETRVDLDTPTVPFFYAWSPTGDRVALLGNAPGGGGLLFGLIDIETEELTTVESPPPFFFDWSPDGTRLIAHVAGTVLRIIDAATGEVRELRQQSGGFPAPIWSEEGIVVAIGVGPTVASPIVPVGFQAASSEVVLIDPVDETRVTLAEVDGPVRLFSTDDALALAVGVAGTQRIDVIGWDGETRATLGKGSIDLVQWSPDGSTLLWTERDADETLTPFTWTGGDTTEYEPFRPSSEFAAAYLPFWDQYDRTISLWAGDSAAFSLPTDEGVVVHQLDGTSTTYTNWDMAVWTREPSGG